eukprot:CAMPEP_0196644768 /NCGR_PEP_ID=MMETSP1085-20130531/7634_1 /TAXON_ID=41879 ORGANISM="Pycnococcus sp, Strain CCMP1998" /NCGR_SAMPLE_ID=MMETSP1085 /ASSEMBLY_ACC=CAM_ASM_000807 /LENGTH=34 /DNA_ID= /DNA_START= /DNA_END= /DNA_ORIENTATION=
MPGGWNTLEEDPFQESLMGDEEGEEDRSWWFVRA